MAFNLKSSGPFKMMGSSPAKQRDLGIKTGGMTQQPNLKKPSIKADGYFKKLENLKPSKKEQEKSKGQDKKLLISENKGTSTYNGKNNTEIQNDLEDRIEFINEDISKDGKSTSQQKIDLAVLKGKLRKAKEAAPATPPARKR